MSELYVSQKGTKRNTYIDCILPQALSRSAGCKIYIMVWGRVDARHPLVNRMYGKSDLNTTEWPKIQQQVAVTITLHACNTGAVLKLKLMLRGRWRFHGRVEGSCASKAGCANGCALCPSSGCGPLPLPPFSYSCATPLPLRPRLPRLTCAQQ